MIAALFTVGALVTTIAIGLSLASARLKGDRDEVVEQLDKLLPQTQCGRCSFPGCRPYAEAIVAGVAEINQCPPGGEATIVAIAQLLDQSPLPPDSAFGEASRPLQQGGIVLILGGGVLGYRAVVEETFPHVDAAKELPDTLHVWV